MTTILTRSTLAINRFVQASRRAAAAALELKQAESEMQQLTEEVLQQIGESRTTRVDGAMVTLTPRVTEKVTRVCTDEEAVQFFRSHGLPVNTRSAEYIAPAAFTSQVRKGAVESSLYSVEVTRGVNVI